MPDKPITDIAQLSFLVVEDEAFSLAAITKTLAGMGAKEIATAADGIKALAHLDQQTPPDVMLLDLNMPEMGGVGVLRHLAERDYTGAIILVSGADKDTIAVAESLANYRELNVLGNIVKPMTAASLGTLLAPLLNP